MKVCHDLDGDWQFLCGGDHSESRPVIVCLGCALELDSELGQLADLPPGWAARRKRAAAAWSRELLPPDEDGQ